MAETAMPSKESSAHFPAEIEVALKQVRDRCGAIIEAACGSGARAKDVSDRFGIHAKLGWQLWNLAYSPPLSALPYLPNDRGLEVWRLAAIAKDVPEILLTAFQDSVVELQGVMGRHAHDRGMFEKLLDAHATVQSEGAELKWRKQSFAGNSYTFGVQAKCMLTTAILFPAEKPHRISLVRLHALIDLVRTRSGVRWPFASLYATHNGEILGPKREPLDWNSKVVPLLPDYCSKPLPAIERRLDGEMLVDELMPGLVGLTGASTIFTGEILHDLAPSHGAKAGEVAHFGSGVRTPCELLICDHIVHRSLFPGATRELRVFSELISQTTRDDRDRLEISEKLRHLGRGLHRVRTADVPNYAELLDETFRRISMNPEEFDVYRIRLGYPPIPASAMVRFQLPPPPTN